MSDLIMRNEDPVLNSANILQEMAKSNKYSPDVTEALYLAVDYLMDAYYKKRDLGNDLLVDVLKNYEIDNSGNVVKKKNVEK